MTTSLPHDPAGDRPTALRPAGGRALFARGEIQAIHVAPSSGAPMEPVERIRAIAGVGLDGDRYATGSGHWSGDGKVDRDITLIEAEELEALAARADAVLGDGDTRRNVTTRGIRLDDLIGRRFRIGTVECEGTRLCEPCQYLAELLGRPVVALLVHRAGLRARILTDGEIAVGDEIVVLD